MKIEEEENALKFLIDAIENSNGESFSEAVFEHFGSDTINVLTVLKENDLIDFHRMGNDLRCFRITSEGQKYFDKKDQAKRTTGNRSSFPMLETSLNRLSFRSLQP